MSSRNANLVLGANDHANNFAVRFMELLHERELVDVILVADDHSFPAHRLILSALSPYFRKMFKQMAVNQQAYVFMNGVSKQTMEHLVQYMYNGEVELHQESLADFLEKAKSLEIDGICDDNYWQTSDQQPPNDSARNVAGPSNAGIQYQTSHVNRFQSSSGARNETLPASTFGSSHLPHTNQLPFANSDYDDSNTSTHNQMDGDYYDFDSVGQVFDHENVQWDQTYDNEDEQFAENKGKTSSAPTAKRSKRNNDLSEYNQPADIRIQNGRENLYKDDYKFSKQGKPNAHQNQRWQCSKQSSEKCKGAMSTIEIDGVIMMKVLNAEHTHQVDH